MCSQNLEFLTFNHGVLGSSPSGLTIKSVCLTRSVTYVSSRSLHFPQYLPSRRSHLESAPGSKPRDAGNVTRPV
jgi:hypothetical protein